MVMVHFERDDVAFRRFFPNINVWVVDTVKQFVQVVFEHPLFIQSFYSLSRRGADYYRFLVVKLLEENIWG